MEQFVIALPSKSNSSATPPPPLNQSDVDEDYETVQQLHPLSICHCSTIRMCRYREDEDDLLSNRENIQSTANGTRRVDPQIQAQIANLEARIRRVEAWMERLEVRVFYLQRGTYVLWSAFLLTLAYAIYK